MINEFIIKNISREDGWQERLNVASKFLFIFFAIVAIGVQNK